MANLALTLALQGCGAEAIFLSARLSAPGAEKSRQMSALGSAPLEILKIPKYIVLNFKKNFSAPSAPNKALHTLIFSYFSVLLQF